MKTNRTNRRTITALLSVLAVGACGNVAWAGDPATKGEAAEVPPDNTGRNVRDRDGETLTAGDQSETEADRTLTQKIRQAVIADDDLSMSAKNVKIITINGLVTLRGPVKSAQERTKIGDMATQIAGANKVHNQLEVTN